MSVPEPRANPLLVGHAAAETTLAEAMRSGRLHHAWLITGPQGIGKATLAFRFARRLLAGAASDAADKVDLALDMARDDSSQSVDAADTLAADRCACETSRP